MSTASPPTPDAAAVAAGPAATLVLGDGASVRLVVRGRDSAGEWARILATDAAGLVVGRAAYARVYGPRAELTLVVDDAYWDRGLADALLATLRARAALHEIATLLVRVRPSDVRLLALLRRAGAGGETASGGRVDVELPTGSAPADRALGRGHPQLPAEAVVNYAPRRRRSPVGTQPPPP